MAGYLLMPNRFRDTWLFLWSLLFYFFAAGIYVVLLLLCALVNYLICVPINKESGRNRSLWLGAGIFINLIVLSYYKYFAFGWQTIDSFLILISFPALGDSPNVFLPIGISFFTFKAISYLIDVYRRQIIPATGFMDFAAYFAAFPQLIAGPIVRYAQVCYVLKDRRINRDDLFEGIWRFSVGLGKKIIIADNLNLMVVQISGLPASELSCDLTWLRVICYSLVIYFDFSGYSDMAIGLGRMMGYNYPENFDHPYQATNVTEFWRRWHMTLTSWFRDYLYIPLGGNRKGNIRTYFNLFTVFLLCGIWHGASLNFLIWGVYHGILLIVERCLKSGLNYRPSGILGLFVTNMLVTLGWIFFSTSDLIQSKEVFLRLLGFGEVGFQYFGIWFFLTNDKLFVLCIALLLVFLPYNTLGLRIVDERMITLGKCVLALVVLYYSLVVLSTNTFNPFIYLRF